LADSSSIALPFKILSIDLNLSVPLSSCLLLVDSNPSPSDTWGNENLSNR